MSGFFDMPPDLVSGSVPTRFEDIVKDGRATLISMPVVIGLVWPKLAKDLGIELGQPSDIVPILSRLVIEGGGGPIAAGSTLSGRGTYQLAHSKSRTGDVERLFVNMWGVLEGVIGHTHGFVVDGAGNPVEVGRVFAEYVVTRPFAPPEQRRVTSIDGQVPPRVYVFRGPDAVYGDDALDWDELATDATITTFGLLHTDSNQHVNSLVYPRLFEEAALRRAGNGDLLGRSLEIMFRKPCFAGERVQVTLQMGKRGDDVVARGFIAAPGEPFDKARAYARLTLTR